MRPALSGRRPAWCTGQGAVSCSLAASALTACLSLHSCHWLRPANHFRPYARPAAAHPEPHCCALQEICDLMLECLSDNPEERPTAQQVRPLDSQYWGGCWLACPCMPAAVYRVVAACVLLIPTCLPRPTYLQLMARLGEGHEKSQPAKAAVSPSLPRPPPAAPAAQQPALAAGQPAAVPCPFTAAAGVAPKVPPTPSQ